MPSLVSQLPNRSCLRNCSAVGGNLSCRYVAGYLGGHKGLFAREFLFRALHGKDIPFTMDSKELLKLICNLGTCL